MAWRLDGRSHPAVTLPNDFALHYSLSVRGPVATVYIKKKLEKPKIWLFEDKKKVVNWGYYL